MEKTLLIAALTLSSLFSVTSFAAAPAQATMVLINNTNDDPAGSEVADILVQGRAVGLHAQQQTSVSVQANQTFVVKVTRIALSNEPINKNNYTGCFNGINMSLSPGQTGYLNINANMIPVTKKTIFSCTFTK